MFLSRSQTKDETEKIKFHPHADIYESRRERKTSRVCLGMIPAQEKNFKKIMANFCLFHRLI